MVNGTEFLDGGVIFWFLATKLFSQITIGLEDESKLYGVRTWLQGNPMISKFCSLYFSYNFWRPGQQKI